MKLTLEVPFSRVQQTLSDTVRDLALDGLGPDGESSYQVKEFSITPMTPVTIEIEVEHVEGKFVSRDEILEAVTEIIELDF